MTPILCEHFYHDGRGPELIKAHYSLRGSTLTAIEFYNPDDTYDEISIKHLIFHGPQAFMWTPEEEFSYESSPIDWHLYAPAAIMDLGHSLWFKSFSERHLSECRHFQLTFYDEYLDIICREIEFRLGSFNAQQDAAANP